MHGPDEFVKLFLQVRVISKRMAKDGVVVDEHQRIAVYRAKRTGLRTDPCGTPQQTGSWAELQFLSVTV